MNPHIKIKKLQMALSRKGRKFTINHYQSFLQQSDKLITKYTVIEHSEKEKKVVLETFSLIAVLKFLADENKEGAG